MQQTRGQDTVAERLSQLDERVRALQESAARGVVAGREAQARSEAAQSSVARSLAELGTAQAVLSQWMKDWTSEVAAWRESVDRRAGALEARQEAMAREQEQARGALRAAMWVFGTALTAVAGVLSGVLGRLVSGAWARGAP